MPNAGVEKSLLERIHPQLDHQTTLGVGLAIIFLIQAIHEARIQDTTTVDGSEVRRSPVEVSSLSFIQPSNDHSQLSESLVGGFNPSEKYARQIGSFPRGSG